MPVSPILDLLTISLPVGISINELRKFAPEILWESDPEKAAIYALHACKNIDWDSYLALYPDVAQSNIHPALHYIKHGIFERRKLFSCHHLKNKNEMENQPLVSVIIPNHNNDIFLPKCIESIIGQTLSNIEIIIIDDCSTDKSVEIIELYEKRDTRIKFIRKSENVGTFSARKEGVFTATGKYIMFVDADDFISTDTCNILYNIITQGYDIVEFGVNILNPGNAEASAISNCLRYLNGGENRLYDHIALLDALFIKQNLPWSIWNKIYLAELCKTAHSELDDGYMIIAEDVYEMLAISRHARNMLKIADKLYYYNYSSGITNSSQIRKQYKNWFTVGDVVKKIGAYADKYNINIYFERINFQHCVAAIVKWLSLVEDNDLVPYLNMIKSQYGFNTFMTALVERFSANMSMLAQRFSVYFEHKNVNTKDIKNIAICVAGNMNTGDMIRLNLYYHKLVKSGYSVSIIITGYGDDSKALPDGATIYHIPHKRDASANQQHKYTQSQEAIIKRHNFDLAIYITDPDPSLFWDFLMWDHYNVPVIVFYDIIASRFIPNNLLNKYQTLDIVLKCATAVISNSRFAQSLCHSIGLNAYYLPILNPKKEANNWVMKQKQWIAVYFDSDSEESQLGQSLLVLKEIVRECPWIKMMIIGKFGKPEWKQAFLDNIKKNDLANHIHLTNRTDKYWLFFQQCGVFLSTAYTHTGLLPLMIAQSFGLPSVIYDIPADIAHEDNGVSIVKQHDFKTAAKKIINLLQSKEYWMQQAKRARTSHEITNAYFNNSLQAILHNLKTASKVTNIPYYELRQFVNYATDYAIQPKPQLM